MPIVQVRDLAMYYETHGEGEPVLLIGGLATDVTDYETIIRDLAQSYRIIAFDNRGVGRSDKPKGQYSIDLLAQDTAGLLGALGVGPTNVIGVSMGGRIALALTLGYPSLVKSLILVSTSARRLPQTRLSRLIDWWGAVPFLRTLGAPYPQPAYAFFQQRQASRDYDATARLSEIRAPTLILHGKRDRIAPYEYAEEMHARISSSRLIAFDGGHLFLFFQAKRFLAVVHEFLSATSESG